MSETNVSFSAGLAESGRYMDKIVYKATATTLLSTTVPQVLGGEISGCQGADFINLTFELDINSAQNVRIYLYGMYVSAGAEYLVPYKDSADGTTDYYEVPTDADAHRFVSWTVNKAFPIYVFRALMATDGGTDPDIEHSEVSISRR